MGAKSSYRMFARALLAGERFDTGVGGILRVLPQADSTAALQIGSSSTGLGFKVFAGSASSFFYASRENESVLVRGMTINAAGQSIVASALNTSGLELSAEFSSDALNCTSLNVTGAATTNTLNTVTLSVSSSFDASVINCNTLNLSGALSPTSVNANSATVTGTVTAQSADITGDAVLGNAAAAVGCLVTLAANTTVQFDHSNSSLKLRSVELNSDTAAVLASVSGVTTLTAPAIAANGLTVNGAITGQSAAIIPSADDTGTVSIGNATVGMDVLITMVSTTNWTRFDRGDTQWQIVGLNLDSDSPVVVNAAITSDNTVSCHSLSFGTINAGNTVAQLNLNSATIVPDADDGTPVTIGNATLGMDFTVFYADSNKYVRFDRGLSSMIMRGVELDTNAPVVVNSTITADWVNTPQINTGSMQVTGTFSEGSIVRKIATVSANTTLTFADSGKTFLVNTTSDDVYITLPESSDWDQVRVDWFEFINIGTGSMFFLSTGAPDLAWGSDATDDTHEWNQQYMHVIYRNVNVRWSGWSFGGSTPVVT